MKTEYFATGECDQNEQSQVSRKLRTNFSMSSTRNASVCQNNCVFAIFLNLKFRQILNIRNVRKMEQEQNYIMQTTGGNRPSVAHQYIVRLKKQNMKQAGDTQQ